MLWLADVNFLVALLDEKHKFSERAVRWLELQNSPQSVLLCRVAQMGALRVLTNAAWLKDEVFSAAEIWHALDFLLTDERFARVPEPTGLEATWRQLTYPVERGRSAETDSYLAAFALAGEYRMLTFDRGFLDFEGLEVEIPP